MGKKFELANSEEHPCLLLCEGVDEKNFLIWYLNNYLSKQSRVFDNIQICDFGGNEELPKKLTLLPAVAGFENIKAIGIIRDAEGDATGAEESIRNCLTTIDISTSYYLLPGKNVNGQWQNGTLEDLSVKILKKSFGANELASEGILNLADEFLSEVERARGCPFARKHKNLLHTVFSSTDKLVTAKIGEAARMGAFDWESDYLNDLRQFLFELAQRGEMSR